MDTLGSAIYYVGLVVCIVGSVWMLILAFQESILWGLGCLCVPFVGLVFLIMHWPTTKNPLIVYVTGLATLFVGNLLRASGGP